jgi:hypothetical protein
VTGNGDTFVVNASGFSLPAQIVQGGVTNSVGQVIALTNSVFTITGDLGTNQYAGATFQVVGVAFTIAANTNTTVTVSGAPTLPFVLHDDDDDTILPRLPDTSDLARAFRPAYVIPFSDLANAATNAPFVANLNNDSGSYMRTLYAFDNVSTEGSPDFWTVYVIGSFQQLTALDGDPSREPAVLGEVDDINGQGAMIFLEALRETPATSYVSEQYTVSHEVGHLFNGDHLDLGLMAQSNIRTNVDFSPTTLNRIRIIPHP